MSGAVVKEWLTAREIATEELPDMPSTESAVIRYADRESWDGTSCARKRPGRGGATEYHVSLLPTLAQVTYAQKHMVVDLPDRTTAPAPVEPSVALSGRAQQERDARLSIVKAYQVFTRTLRLGHATHLQVFTDKYNLGSIEVAGWVRELVPSVSKRSLIRWIAAKRDQRVGELAVDRSKARKGTGILDLAEGGRVKAFMLALIAHQPHLAAAEVRTQCRYEFGDSIKTILKGVQTSVEMPPVRTFQHAIKQMKKDHKVELVKLTNPDLFRSTMKLSGVGTLRHITQPNQLWQIDASPVDALCVDGRHAIYACIDIATRRTVLSVSRTPRASAVALLMRKAILAWGIPKLVKTDNGSDFVAKDTTRLFAFLDIEPELSDAYSPEQKGHVERVIRTFQHNVGPLLPGYVGHSVADRKEIESRKSFAARLGDSDAETFAVSLSGAELQNHVDDWMEKVYQHRPHAGLKQQTPFAAAAASTAVKRTVDERALDLLLMPVAGSDGQRIVTKFGVRIDHRHYLAPTIMPGTSVFVRQDPNDLGRAYVFAQDGGEFLAVATCAELSGIHPETFVTAQKEIQRDLLADRTRQLKADMRRIAKGPTLIQKSLEVAARDVPNIIPLPKREVAHTTPQISAAIEAMAERVNPSKPLDPRAAAEHRRLIDELLAEDEARLIESTEAIYERRLAEIEAARTAHLPRGDNVVALPESPKERYRRALALRVAVEGGCDPGEFADGMWLSRYEQSAEFKAQARMHEDFGDAYLS